MANSLIIWIPKLSEVMLRSVVGIDSLCTGWRDYEPKFLSKDQTLIYYFVESGTGS